MFYALNTPFRSALVTLSSNFKPVSKDELEVVEKIRRKLIRHRNEKEAVNFSELYRKLQSHQVLKDRWSVLHLLYSLTRLDYASQHNFSKFDMPSANLASTPLHQHEPIISNSTTSINASKNKEIITGFMNGHHQTANENAKLPLSFNTSVVNKPAASIGSNRLREMNSIGPAARAQTSYQISKASLSFSEDFPESVLLRDVLCALQGIEGRYIKYDVKKDAYVIHPEVEISNSSKKLINRLCECGFLHNKIQHYVNAKCSLGLVKESFCSALRQELTEYYRLIANLEAQLQQESILETSEQLSSTLTLRRMMVSLNEPMKRMTLLASLVDICQAKKGGELTSAVYSFMRHGDPSVQSLMYNILTLVAQPVFNFVVKWIFDGELEDHHQEFFVTSNASVENDKLWHDKYSLRKNMIPSFIPHDQARKILLTGKTISFLRQVCSDRTLVKERDVVVVASTDKVETIFSQNQEPTFTKMIDVAYRETSSYLLKVLYEKFKFMEHLKAMRRYMLLGQGDFIRHLMDLLEEDLAKPAKSLFLHNLTGTLESAIRATNAQFDDPDIVKRLDVRLLEKSSGDTGWDVFSLEYHISGHIRTVFTPESMNTYMLVSNFLWRAKRIEYILSSVKKEQMTHEKPLRRCKEFSPILHKCYLIGSEMMHFVRQIQYYINFEVLECSWIELMSKVEEADDLDQVINAHQEFLSTITSRSLLDPQSTPISTQLKGIFDLVIQFQELQTCLHNKMIAEVDFRKELEEQKVSRSQKGTWGTDENMESREKQRREEFFKGFVLVKMQELEKLGKSYKKMVERFLNLVTTFSDISLRCLIFRLNFSEHYKHQQSHAGRVSGIVVPPILQSKRKAK